MPSKRNRQLVTLIQWMNNHSLDLENFSLYMRNTRDCPFELDFTQQAFSFYNEEERKRLLQTQAILIRRLKYLFGPLVAKGEPPYVVLDGFAEFSPGLNVKFELHGAFECEVQGYREEEVEVPATEAVEAVPAHMEVKQVPIYNCKPKEI